MQKGAFLHFEQPCRYLSCNDLAINVTGCLTWRLGSLDFPRMRLRLPAGGSAEAKLSAAAGRLQAGRLADPFDAGFFVTASRATIMALVHSVVTASPDENLAIAKPCGPGLMIADSGGSLVPMRCRLSTNALQSKVSTTRKSAADASGSMTQSDSADSDSASSPTDSPHFELSITIMDGAVLELLDLPYRPSKSSESSKDFERGGGDGDGDADGDVAQDAVDFRRLISSK